MGNLCEQASRTLGPVPDFPRGLAKLNPRFCNAEFVGSSAVFPTHQPMPEASRPTPKRGTSNGQSLPGYATE